MPLLPRQTPVVIVGAGFAGAAAGWALGRAGIGAGVILEQETTWGVHASGRNAAMLRLAESDPVVAALAHRSLGHLRLLSRTGGALLGGAGGLTVAGELGASGIAVFREDLKRRGTPAELLTRAAARARFPWLERVEFDTALWCPDEAVVDIHALLGLYLQLARATGFELHTGCRAEGLLVEGGRACGVQTSRGDVRAPLVVDAGGAWAGRLATGAAPLPLEPLRRHLFVSTPMADMPPAAPHVWMEDAALYFRPESGGLLLSPCDETPWPPGTPPTDPAAAESLAEKMARHAPGFADLAVRRSWACLRTFAPDRRPVVGPDPRVPGLFHVSGLGGIGMMCSAAIGELAACLIEGRPVDWVDARAVAPDRFMRGTAGPALRQ